MPLAPQQQQQICKEMMDEGMAKAIVEDQEEEPQKEWREEKLQKESKEQDQIAQAVWNGKNVNNETGQDTDLPCDALQD